MTSRAVTLLERVLVDTHLWVGLAAAGLGLFAAASLGVAAVPSAGLLFSATVLIYSVDDVFDGRMRRQPARWVTLAASALALATQLWVAPRAVAALILLGAPPALLYAAPIRGRRLRDLPGVKPLFVASSLTVAAVTVPLVWAWAEGVIVDTTRAPQTAYFLFVVVLCNVCFFDLRDRETDAAAGVGTIPVRAGVSGTRRLCVALCLLTGVVVLSTTAPPALWLALGGTVFYALALPEGAGRLTYALVVDGVPILLGLASLRSAA